MRGFFIFHFRYFSHGTTPSFSENETTNTRVTQITTSHSLALPPFHPSTLPRLALYSKQTHQHLELLSNPHPKLLALLPTYIISTPLEYQQSIRTAQLVNIMAALASSASSIQRDIRSDSRSYKRDKDQSSKWAMGSRPSYGVRKSCWEPDVFLTGSPEQQAKIRPQKKYSD